MRAYTEYRDACVYIYIYLFIYMYIYIYLHCNLGGDISPPELPATPVCGRRRATAASSTAWHDSGVATVGAGGCAARPQT